MINWRFNKQLFCLFQANPHPGTLVIAAVPPPDGKHGNFHMYATMRPPPPPRIGSTLVNASGDMFPEFVPPPPPMFEGQPGGLPLKPPPPPGKPDKLKQGSKKGEKKRESTV